MKQVFFLFMALAPIIYALDTTAQERRGSPNHSEKLGKVHFPISCGAGIQAPFDHAVALLHSFQYDQAERSFTTLTQSDPQCAIAYWGIAMSLYHPLWAPPTPQELKKGAEAVEKAESATPKTDRERDYMAAIAAFYKDSETLDHRTRALAYEKAMGHVYSRYPKDLEAAVFYALALNGTALPADKSYANQKKAAKILTEVLQEAPDHPGVAHYMIHSYDYPQLADLALPAARSYAKIAPSSSHALHMPSHIFTRLGLWQESIESNRASATAAKERVSKTQPGAGSFEQLHAMDYLAYAYLQGAQDGKAREVLDALGAIEKVDTEGLPAAYAFAAIPARVAFERRNWAEAAALTIRPSSFPWGRFRQAEAITHFARGAGAARSGDLSSARKEVEALQSIRQALVDAKENYWADQVEVQRRTLAAWLARAEGKDKEASDLMRSAADLEGATEKHPVTPGPIVPARESLADLLMEMGRPAEALQEYEKTLQVSPNRFNAIYGAAKASERSGNIDKARSFYTQLVTLSTAADGKRPEVSEARAFLAKKSAGNRG